MQGGARCEVRGVLGPYAAAPRERANAADGPFSAACWNFLDVLAKPEIKRSFFNRGMIATLASILSLAVTVTSGFMPSRLRGKPASTWFGMNFEL